jgi:RecG-like helicase
MREQIAIRAPSICGVSIDQRIREDGLQRFAWMGTKVLSEHFLMPQYQVSIVHGQMKADAKEYEMQRFVKGSNTNNGGHHCY